MINMKLRGGIICIVMLLFAGLITKDFYETTRIESAASAEVSTEAVEE